MRRDTMNGSHIRVENLSVSIGGLPVLKDVLAARRKAGSPLPILAVSNFGHGLARNLMAVPIGGRVTISKSKKIVFRLP